MGNKGKLKVKVTAKKGKPVKPQFGSNDGGLLTAKIVATVRKTKK